MEIITREKQLETELRCLLNCAKAAVLVPNDLHIGVLKHACHDAEKLLTEPELSPFEHAVNKLLNR